MLKTTTWMKATAAAAAMATTLASGQLAHATSVTHMNGFEAPGDTADWLGSGGITRVGSGGGALGLASNGGSFHAEITEGGPNDGGYTYFGGGQTTYPGSAFIQSLDIYIDLGWNDPTSGGDGFKLNMFPMRTTGGTISQAGEQFLFSFNGDGHIEVEANGLGGQGTLITTITNSGWYTFAGTFRKAGDGVGPIETDLSVFNSFGDLLGVQTRGSANQGVSDSAQLGGHGYIWVSNWVDGFADNTLAIDNATVSLVPTPAAAGAALAMVGGMLLRRRGGRLSD